VEATAIFCADVTESMSSTGAPSSIPVSAESLGPMKGLRPHYLRASSIAGLTSPFQGATGLKGRVAALIRVFSGGVVIEPPNVSRGSNYCAPAPNRAILAAA